MINISRLAVCRDCLPDMRLIKTGVCFVCREQLLSPYAFAGTPDEPRCELCRRLEPPFARAVASGSYEGGLRDLIHLLKYEHVLSAARVLGRMLAEAMNQLETSWTQPSVAVVLVPLYTRKLRQRGFNQSELIVRNALKLGDGSGRFTLHSEVRQRCRATQSQTGFTRPQRRENIRGAFAVARPERIAGCEVLLVDDVFTTGTTVSECARVLRRAGASKVFVATVAQTLKADAKGVLLPQALAEEEHVMAAAG